MEVVLSRTQRLPRLPRGLCRSCSRQVGAGRRSPSRRQYSSQSQPEIYDVVCVGGGPAGLSLLTALRKHTSASACMNYPNVQIRDESCHSRPPCSSSRSPGPLVENAVMEAPARPILEPMQLSHAQVRAVPRSDRSVGPPAARPRSALPRDAGVGRRDRCADRV